MKFQVILKKYEIYEVEADSYSEAEDMALDLCDKDIDAWESPVDEIEVEVIKESTKEDEWQNNLIKIFPWLCIDRNDNLTWLDLMPIGWKKAFGIPMAWDIQTALNELTEEERESFLILEVKEKYFSLRIYTAPYFENVEKVIRKYEELSKKICLKCGSSKKKPYGLCESCQK